MGNAKPDPSGVELARLRIAAGLSARQLAEKAGVSHVAVSQAERGRGVTREVLDGLVKVLGPAARDTVTLWPPEPGAGTVLAVARTATGETCKQAALRAGVSRFVFSRAERGERVHPANAKRIADAFGLDVEDVLPFPFREASTDQAA